MTTMSTGTADPEPVKTSIAPWLSVSRATEAVTYYKAAFGAVEHYRLEDDEGSVVVAQLAIEGADFWLQEDADSSLVSQDHRSVRMILTVSDPDSVFAQAIAAGAREVGAVSEGHGWRIGRLADPFGHHWEIGKPLR
ncbi:MAG TPA: VOC family protein [Ktedonosporobacter sp.]|nr:VOC family protein [Ktedonosporobacter sp.]